MSRKNRDLWAMVAVLAAAVAAQLFPVPALVRGASGLALVILCPGYGLMAALFPSHALGRAERALLTLGLSLSVAIVGTVILNFTPWGLTVPAWIVVFSLVTVTACLIAGWRRAGPGAVPVQPDIRPLRLPEWALLGLAGLVTVGAMTWVRLPRPVTGVTGYTLLSITPSAAAPGAPTRGAVSLMLSSSEFSPTQYRLTVRLDGQTVQEWPAITLAPAGKWEQVISLPQARPGGIVEATLYRLDNPTLVYRAVTLAIAQ